MLIELYKKGFLNYKDVILEYYKDLLLTEKEAFVLIKILNSFYLRQTIKTSELVQSTSFSKLEIQEVLYRLSELGYYETYFVVEKGIADEYYRIDPLFSKIEELMALHVGAQLDEDDLQKIINSLEKKLCRDITPNELQTVSGWLLSFMNANEIINIIENYNSGVINFKAIEKQITINRKIPLKA